MIYLNHTFNLSGNFVKKVKMVRRTYIEIILPVPMEITVPISCSAIFITSPAITFLPEKFSLILADNSLKDLCTRAATLSKCVILSRETWGFDA